MNLLRFVLESSRSLLAMVVLAAVIAGACNAGLIATLNHALHAGGPRDGLAVLFVVLATVRIVASGLSQLALVRFAQATVARLRNKLVARILQVPLAELEELGAPRLTASLSDDTLHVTTGLVGVPQLIVNLALIGCGGLYLTWLAPEVVVWMTGLVAAGALVHRLLFASGMHFVRLARDDQDRMFAYVRALTQGIKELKLHSKRRRQFLERCVEAVTDDHRQNNCAAEARFIASTNLSTLLFLALVGMVVLVAPRFIPLGTETLSGFVLTCSFLMGPLAAVLGSFSYLGRANVALTRIQALGLALDARASEPAIDIEVAAETFQSLELCGVTHIYHTDRDDRPFQLGPIDLSLSRGELVFLAGGNGSGKSTLAKVLTGLYAPESGSVRLNGREVHDAERDRYRQHFSAVFGDFYLFEELLGIDVSGRDARAREYLRKLRLDRCVKIEDGRLSTTKLSTGQRKRLALLVAYLEDRPCYVFDEWAADQDPEFKEFFYTCLLQELRARQKALLVITHDDRWFGVADRLLKLDSGRMETGTQVARV